MIDPSNIERIILARTTMQSTLYEWTESATFNHLTIILPDVLQLPGGSFSLICFV